MLRMKWAKCVIRVWTLEILWALQSENFLGRDNFGTTTVDEMTVLQSTLKKWRVRLRIRFI